MFCVYIFIVTIYVVLRLICLLLYIVVVIVAARVCMYIYFLTLHIHIPCVNIINHFSSFCVALMISSSGSSRVDRGFNFEAM